MSYLIVLLVVAVEALNLGLLWIALRVDMRRMIRPLIAGFGMSGAWGAWILVLVLHDPLSMRVLTGVVFAVSSVAMGIAIHRATVEEDGLGGGEGGAPTVIPDLPGGGGDDEPAWWPEFQRQVAAYAAGRDREPEREREPVDC